MKFAHASVILLAALVVAACSSPSVEYPTLSIRDAERVSTQMQAATGDEAYIPAAPSGTVLERLAQLRIQARDAHQSFTTNLPSARRTINSARNVSLESDAWASAQIALADLESNRSRALMALTDLDALFVEAQLEAASVSEIETVRQEVNMWVESQNQQIDGLFSALKGS